MMSRSEFWRVVWKEYRTQRAFWLSMVVITVGLQFLFLASYFLSAARSPETPSGEFTFGIAMVLAALYAAGCGATMFAIEHEDGTYEFQRTLPVGPYRVLAGKVAVAVTSAYILLGLTNLIGLALCQYVGSAVRAHMLARLWANMATAPLEMLAWGMFFSLLVARPLVAALLTLAAGAGYCSLLMAASESVGGSGSVQVSYLRPTLIRVVAMMVLAAAIVWLTRRWFRRPPDLVQTVRGLLRWPESLERRSRRSSSGGVRQNGLFGRLVWQQWSQSLPMMAAIGLLVVLLALGMMWLWHGSHGRGDWYPFRMFATVMACGVASLVGACVFHGDQRGGSLRFLGEHGAEATSVWLSRQIVWIVPLLVLATLAIVQTDVEPNLPSETDVIRDFRAEDVPAILMMMQIPSHVISLMLLAFSAGQLGSMLLRSGLLAAVSGLFLTGLLCGWAGLMMLLDVSWVWSVWPIPVVLLVATWLRTSAWLVERKTLRVWAPVGACLLLPTIALLMAVPLYRVYSIPAVNPGFAPEEYAKPGSPEAQETAHLYERAWAPYVSPKRSSPDGKPWGPEQSIWEWMSDERWPAIRSAWVEANKEAIDLAIEASRRPGCECLDQSASGFRGSLATSMADLGALLTCSAQELEERGELGTALDRHLAALRVAGHMHSRTTWFPTANRLENLVYDGLVGWAGRPKQTSDRIVGAMRQLDAIERLQPPPTDAIKTSYLTMRGAILEDPMSLGYAVGSDGVFRVVFWNRVLPWEKYRSLRILNELTNRELHEWTAGDPVGRGVRLARTKDFGYGSPPLPPYSFFLWTSEVKDISPEAVGERLARDFAFMTTTRRAARVQLALGAWKAKHGKLPKSLTELVGPYLDKLPEDPFAGEPFSYFPEGLSVPVRQAARAFRQWYLWPYPGSTISQGRALLWSPGAELFVQRDQSGLGPRWYGLVSSDAFSRTLSQLEAQMRGWAFPVP